jgi:hypothetical protein
MNVNDGMYKCLKKDDRKTLTIRSQPAHLDHQPIDSLKGFPAWREQECTDRQRGLFENRAQLCPHVIGYV